MTMHKCNLFNSVPAATPSSHTPSYISLGEDQYPMANLKAPYFEEGIRKTKPPIHATKILNFCNAFISLLYT